MQQTEQPGSYGLCSDLFVTRKAGGDTLLVGGTAEDQTRWMRVLSHRAAQVIWFRLTRFLYPERSDDATALAATAAMRSADAPTITSHAEVARHKDGGYEIIGIAGLKQWTARMSETDAPAFWTALDAALHPNG